MHQLMFVMTFVAMSSASFAAFGKGEPTVPAVQQAYCKAYLDSDRYEVSTVFGFKNATWSLKPEVGSVEYEYPGAVANLMRIRSEFLQDRKRLSNQNDPYEVGRLIERLIDRLLNMKIRAPDKRLSSMIEQIWPYLTVQKAAVFWTDPNEVSTRLIAKLWELTMACFFDGENIHIGKTVEALFPREAAIARRGHDSQFTDRAWYRELDIAVERWDGTWHWVEVKNWAPSVATRPQHKNEILHQNDGQNISRFLLTNHEIDISLVMKFGLSPEDAQFYRERTDFNNILFALPEGAP